MSRPIGKAGGDGNQSSHQSGDGIEDGGAENHMDHVLFIAQVSAVDDHAAARNGQGEEGLSHGPDPRHGILQRIPAEGEHELVTFSGTGQHGHAHSQHHKDDEEGGDENKNPDAVWKNNLIYVIIHPSQLYHIPRGTIDSGI